MRWEGGVGGALAGRALAGKECSSKLTDSYNDSLNLICTNGPRSLATVPPLSGAVALEVLHQSGRYYFTLNWAVMGAELGVLEGAGRSADCQVATNLSFLRGQSQFVLHGNKEGTQNAQKLLIVRVSGANRFLHLGRVATSKILNFHLRAQAIQCTVSATT